MLRLRMKPKKSYLTYHNKMFTILNMSLEKRTTYDTSEFQENLDIVFGPGAELIKRQIAHDQPYLSPDDVTRHAWHLIPEATEYIMEPVTKAELTENAIGIHEWYEAMRRVTD